MGYDKLEQVLRWCCELGVHGVTVYAFSIENFKRSQSEVDALMALAEEGLREMSDETHLVQRRGVRVRVVGDLSRVSASLYGEMQRVMRMTQGNTRHTLTVCFSYTSRNEIAASIRRLGKACADGRLLPSDINAALLERCLLTTAPGLPPVDLIVRTSGEKRLSDFLLWQAATCPVMFTAVTWPELSLVRFLGLLLRYQRSAPYFDQVRAWCAASDETLQLASTPQLAATPALAPPSARAPNGERSVTTAVAPEAVPLPLGVHSNEAMPHCIHSCAPALCSATRPWLESQGLACNQGLACSQGLLSQADQRFISAFCCLALLAAMLGGLVVLLRLRGAHDGVFALVASATCSALMWVLMWVLLALTCPFARTRGGDAGGSRATTALSKPSAVCEGKLATVGTSLAVSSGESLARRTPPHHSARVRDFLADLNVDRWS